MINKRIVETSVGFFMLAGLIACLFLAYKVSGMHQQTANGYYVTAEFDHIGSLKKRAPVTIAGVRVGEVNDIQLDNKTLKAKVTLKLSRDQKHIPQDASASILTEGLLGSNYIAISPGLGLDEDGDMLQDGSHIDETQSAIILENLIGQLLFNINRKEARS